MMIVYCAHVNLHTELVKMDSSCVWMSVLTRRLMTDPLEKTWLWWAEIPIELTVATYKWLAKTGIFISSILDYLPLDLFMHHQAWFAAKHTNGLHVYILYLMYYAYSTYISDVLHCLTISHWQSVSNVSAGTTWVQGEMVRQRSMSVIHSPATETTHALPTTVTVLQM